MSHEEELAVVLGHEIEHIELNQCARRLTDEMKKKHIRPDPFDRFPSTTSAIPRARTANSPPSGKA